MDRDSMTRALKGSISEVLEKMFFLPLDFVDPAQPAGERVQEQDLLEISLDFSGPFRGCFIFSIPSTLARSLAADFMGSDASSVTIAQGEETAKEILNMIAGSAFSMFDRNAVFDLGLPKKITGVPVREGGGDEIALGVETLEGRLVLRLIVNGLAKTRSTTAGNIVTP